MTLSFLILALAPAPSSEAFHSTAPVIATEPVSPTRWVALKIASDGSPFSLDVKIPITKGPYQHGMVGFRGSDSWFTGATYTYLPDRDGLVVDARAGDVAIQTGELKDRGALGLEAGYTFNPSYATPFAGTFKVLLWWTGDGPWGWTLRGTPGTSIVASEGGDRVFLHRLADFSGAAEAHAYPAGVGAHAAVDVSLPLQVEDRLFGGFQGGYTAAARLAYTGPDGKRRDCESAYGWPPSGVNSCSFMSLTNFPEMRAGSAGSYVFHATGAGALAGSGDIWLAGADARLPP